MTRKANILADVYAKLGPIQTFSHIWFYRDTVNSKKGNWSFQVEATFIRIHRTNPMNVTFMRLQSNLDDGLFWHSFIRNVDCSLAHWKLLMTQLSLKVIGYMILSTTAAVTTHDNSLTLNSSALPVLEFLFLEFSQKYRCRARVL